MHATLQALRAFFIWLADKPGFRRTLSYSDAEYFNLSEKDARIAKATREKAAPTIEQIHHVLARMPMSTDIERRDRALIAFTLLTGTRDGAIASLKLKHIDIPGRRLDQDAREVKTKFSKTFSTWFFPVGGEALAIVEDWVAYLRGTLLWGNDDPLFPASLMRQGENGGFIVAGLDRKHWSTADPIRRIFAKAFRDAGLDSFNPHSFRNTIVRLGEQLCQTPEEFKAWSQNLGHEKVLTTLHELRRRRSCAAGRTDREPRKGKRGRSDRRLGGAPCPARGRARVRRGTAYAVVSAARTYSPKHP